MIKNWCVCLFLLFAVRAKAQKDSVVYKRVNDTVKEFMHFTADGSVNKGSLVLNKGEWISHGSDSIYNTKQKFFLKREFNLGKPCGKWKEYYSTGMLKEIKYLISDSVSLIIRYSESQQINAVGEFIHEKESGKWSYYYDNGRIKETGAWGQIDLLTQDLNGEVMNKYHLTEVTGRYLSFKKGIWYYYNRKGKSKMVNHNKILEAH